MNRSWLKSNIKNIQTNLNRLSKLSPRPQITAHNVSPEGLGDPLLFRTG